MKLLPLVLVLLLVACASGRTNPEFAVPTCSSDRECEARWNAAEIWIERNVGRPIVERTATMMRTNMSQSPGNYLSVVVEKEHVKGDTFRIDATMYCARKVGCDPSPWEVTRHFNRAVNQAWTVIED